jgi:hypothetical protein
MTFLSPFSLSQAPAKEEMFPDPLLSANVYCAGRLGEALLRVAGALQRELLAEGGAEPGYVWVMRYAKCGEHLKIRVHGPESRRPLIQASLAAAAASYLAGQEAPDPAAPRRTRELAPPIDREDQAPADYPDRTFLWTTYERSHISLGYRPYMNDDVYVALLTRCMGRGTEILLHRLEADGAGQIQHQKLQTLLLKALIAGLSALPLTAEERALYLLYHRDCLLRGALKQAGSAGGPRKMEETLARFRLQVEKLGGEVDGLAETARTRWEGGGERWEGDFEAWSSALAGLAEYVAPLCGGRAYHIDPFAELPLFPAVFKAFHGLANQLGLTPLNEAFAHHLLLSASCSGELRDRPVQLKPALLEMEPLQ